MIHVQNKSLYVALQNLNKPLFSTIDNTNISVGVEPMNHRHSSD
jgi:hypothetical protein